MKYLVDFVDSVTEQQIGDYLQANGLTQVKSYDNFAKVVLVEGENPPPATELIERVAVDDPNGISLLEFVDVIESTVTSTDTISVDDDKQWWKVASLDKLDWNLPTQDIPRRGLKTTIYLVDSGVDTSHPDLVDAGVVNLHAFNGNFTDTKGHGTALASVMVGKTCGIANSTVKSVKIFDANQPTLLSDLIGAMDAIITDYLASGGKPSIANMSWTIAKNEYVENKINAMINYGITIICAAGNSGAAIKDITPASMINVIKVGSYNKDLGPSNFSNYVDGSIISYTAGTVNVPDTLSLFGWAPGEAIWAAGLNGTYGYTAGTSIAAAIASATLAYNQDSRLTGDNNTVTLDPTKYAQSLTGLAFFENLFTRKNILLLTSEYASCKNVISTVHVSSMINSLDLSGPSMAFVIKYNSYYKTQIFDSYKYSSITYNGLPPGLSLSNGYLVGNWITEDTSPMQYVVTGTLSGPGVESLPITMTLTGYNDLQSLNDANLYYHADNPVVQINLTADAYCTDKTPCTDYPYMCNAACTDLYPSVPGGECGAATKDPDCCCLCYAQPGCIA